jgi:pyruvate kinase
VKIVTTLGPVTQKPEAIDALLDAGADVVRLNFAHSDVATHERTIRTVRCRAAARGRTVGVLVDLPGPKMRTGTLAPESVALEPGQEFTLVAGEVEGDHTRVSTTVDGLAGMVEGGDEIYLADGEIVLQVTCVSGGDVHTTVVRGGVLRSRKGLHVPKAERRVKAFTEEDREALRHAMGMGADFIALSFVRDSDDLERARKAIAEIADGTRRGPSVVAKIETASALECIREIVAAADAVMVARGDLGIQTPLKQVPLVQKRIIRACNEAGKPVITATQMLESMTDSPLPTRAEVADVANAVLDGTDAVMLSEETAVGEHPVETVQTMSDIAEAAAGWPRRHPGPLAAALQEDRVSWAVAHAAVQAAEDLEVKAILCPTRSGATPRRVAAFRPSMPVVGVAQERETLGKLTLVWGVCPLGMEAMPDARETQEEVDRVVRAARDAGLIASGDLVAVVAGSPGPRAGRTDFLRIVRV